MVEPEDNGLAGRPLLSSDDLSYDEIARLLVTAEHMRRRVAKGVLGNLEGKIIGRTIFERSTRTDLSFHAATVRLGGDPLGGRFFDGDGSSGGKGESDEDAFRTVAGYSDLMIVRHKLPDFVKTFCPSVYDKPIINAGNGSDEHPTQTLLDWLAITRELGCLNNPSKPDFGRLRGRKLALCGDLRYGRTVTGNLIFAKHFGVDIILASPDELAYPKTPPVEPIFTTNSLSKALAECDIIYMTRVQRERFGPDEEALYNKVAGEFILNLAMYEELFHPHLDEGPLILHPMPRFKDKCEIDPDLDKLKQAAYFRQSAGGVFARMSLLAHLMGVQNKI